MDHNKMTAEDIQSDKKIVVYGRNSCPYCKQAKSILEDDLKQEIDYRNTDVDPKWAKEVDALGATLHWDTVPMIFINKKFIGGCSDLKKLVAKGDIKAML